MPGVRNTTTGVVQTSSGVVQTAPTIPSSGISRYEFEQDVTDSWGSNDGTDNTSAGYVTGNVGIYAKDFDGTDDYVDTGGAIVDPSSSGSFSVAGWVKTTTTDTEDFWTQGNSSNSDPQVRMGKDGSNSVFNIRSDSGGSNNSYSVFGATIDDGNWHHVCITYDSQTMELYTDGGSDGTENRNSESVTTDRTTIGALGRTSLALHWDGQIDDVRIYDKALSSTEVSNLYNNGSI
jgi:hypothetical protein